MLSKVFSKATNDAMLEIIIIMCIAMRILVLFLGFVYHVRYLFPKIVTLSHPNNIKLFECRCIRKLLS